MSKNELLAVITEMQEYRRIADEASAAADALADRIKADMGDTEQLVIGPYKVSYATVTTNRIDSKLLRQDHPTIAELYTRTTTTRRFTVR